MRRKVLSLPFEMLGDRPLWITLTYPRDWRVRVLDGRVFEPHRRAFGERWRRNFGEPVGFWTKEFPLAEGRPHLHLLKKGPECMSDADYRGFQERTRLAKANERAFGKYQGRAKEGEGKLVHRLTGELLSSSVLWISVEEEGRTITDGGIDGLQIAAHSGGGIAVPEHPLDVQEAKWWAPSSVVALCRMPAAVRRRSWGGDVTEAGCLRSGSDRFPVRR